MNEKKSTNRTGLLLGGLLIAVVSFAAGMRSDMVFAAIAPVIGIRVETGTIDLSSVQETYRALKANFDGELDTQKLIDGANRGLVEAAGDPYTAYLNPDAVKELENELSGSIGGGIGAEIGLRNGQLTIIRPLKDSPALQAGIEAGDVIVAVNDEDASGWTVDQVVQKIRGEIGSKVTVKVLRDRETKDITVVRQEVKSPTVEAEIVGDVGILTVHRFNSETGPLARTEAEKFVSSGVKRVVLDLRGNPGGEVTAAQALAGLWLDNQVILTQRRGDEIIQTNKSTGRPILGDIKTVILINGGSASASEIVAGALRDYDKATLVGETTYGKGSVQAVIRLSGGSQLKVTESRWFTPKGKNIDKTGIEPDVKVELTADDVNNNRDPQLEKAKSL